MKRFVLFTIMALLGIVLAQELIEVTFTSDPTGATVSMALGQQPPMWVGVTPFTTLMVPGATYTLRVVAPEPFSTHNLYVPYEQTFIAPLEPAAVSIWIDRTTQQQQDAQRRANTTPPPAAAPAVTRPAPAIRTCCRRCSTGKPCGNSCIARNKTCRVGPGCAC